MWRLNKRSVGGESAGQWRIGEGKGTHRRLPLARDSAKRAYISKILGFYVVTSHEAAGPNRPLRVSLSFALSFLRTIRILIVLPSSSRLSRPSVLRFAVSRLASLLSLCLLHTRIYIDSPRAVGGSSVRHVNRCKSRIRASSR